MNADTDREETPQVVRPVPLSESVTVDRQADNPELIPAAATTTWNALSDGDLLAVNQELQGRLDKLADKNNDLHNLMNAMAIATVVLDRQLRITKYTPTAVELFNLQLGDIGRPLSDLQWNISYPELQHDAALVISELLTVEREVSDQGHDRDQGRWFLARLLPYRTADDHISGVVLTLVNVTAQKNAERILELDLQDTERLRSVGEQLVPEGDMQALFDGILHTGINLVNADAGTIQLLNEELNELNMLSTTGFSKEITAAFARVDASSGSPCGRALADRKRIFMDFDDPNDPDLDGSNAMHLEENVRSAQSTPLISRSGRLVGMMSTHWSNHQHRPTERELRFLDLLARQAADAIERKLSDEALRRQMQTLSRFNSLAVGREMRMIELKKEVNELKRRLGEPPPYPLDFEKEE